MLPLEHRQELAPQPVPLDVVEDAQVAPGEDVLHEPWHVGALLVRDGELLEGVERRAVERAAPPLQLMAPELARRGRPDLAERREGVRLPRILAELMHVPEQCYAATRPHHARDLGHRLGGCEPMERLRGEQAVDRRVRQRHGLGRPV